MPMPQSSRNMTFFDSQIKALPSVPSEVAVMKVMADDIDTSTLWEYENAASKPS